LTARLVRTAFSLALLLIAASAALAEESPLFKIYERYVAAIDKGDLAAAKKYLSSGKLRTLADMSDEEALSAINVISPKEDLRVYKEIVEDDDGTLTVLADVGGNDSTGTIQFLREKSQWKILSEMWDLGGSPEDDTPSEVRQPENDEQREAIRALRERGFPQPTADFLVTSAVTGDLEAVRLFVKAGYSPDTKNQGSPAIVSAAMFGQPEIVLYLIEAGADVNAQDDVQTTALMRTADKCDTTEVVKALLKAGAKTHFKSAGGADALQLAEWSQCTENAALIKAAAKKKK
jgi:hypothetical protein